ncbi:MAG TPA: AAA family ATPase, partial [Polyangiaceae bacterium]|nr:AAA family ATPase [Polyangiaceae bacterium]
MHVRNLAIQNFRAIESVEFEGLSNNVVVAGPNGCGKSTIFHALRLWKSVQAGYVDNEYQQWFGEFEINLTQSTRDLALLFRDKKKPVRIAGSVALAPAEKSFIREHVHHLAREVAWRRAAPRARKGGHAMIATGAAGLIGRSDELDEDASQLVEQITSMLDDELFSSEFEITPDLEINTVGFSPVLALVYAISAPDAIGAFEYQSADRNYQREQVANVDLRIETLTQQQAQNALYNSASKFQNIKSQMVSTYLRELIAEKAGIPSSAGPSLLESLKDLFGSFFPEKEFLGPQPRPNGMISFTVKGADGSEYDINDLSSGEKEVLYGYLRLRNLSRRNSVLLFDEPELHLNPRLIKGLPQFYERQLGTPYNNQIWLLTHSDVLLREALGQGSTSSVYHMVANPPRGSRQLVPVAKGESLDAAILGLVGEAATYQPQAKLVIFEGGGDSELDVTMATDLFPRLAAQSNPISGSNK